MTERNDTERRSGEISVDIGHMLNSRGLLESAWALVREHPGPMTAEETIEAIDRHIGTNQGARLQFAELDGFSGEVYIWRSYMPVDTGDGKGEFIPHFIVDGKKDGKRVMRLIVKFFDPPVGWECVDREHEVDFVDVKAKLGELIERYKKEEDRDEKETIRAEIKVVVSVAAYHIEHEREAELAEMLREESLPEEVYADDERIMSLITKAKAKEVL